MENKFIKKLLILFILLNCIFQAFGQEGENYFLQDTTEGAVFIQRFSWNENPNVLKYEFIMEKQTRKDRWEQIEHKETTSNFIDLSLSAGKYRYKLILYNYLELVELETEWIPVDIIKAYQPKISSVSPSTVYIEENPDGIFSISGSELRDEATFVFKSGPKSVPAIVLNKNAHNSNVKLQFPLESLDSGKWTLVVTNVGGLKDSYENIKIQFKKPMDFDVSGGITPLIILGDSDFRNYFSNNFPPFGVNLKMTFIPVKKLSGYYGVSLSTTAAYFNETPDAYSYYGGYYISALDFTYQKVFGNKKWVFDAHGGLGLSGFFGTAFAFNFNGKSSVPEVFNSTNISLNLGSSIQYYFYKRWYAEFALDFNASFYEAFSNSEYQSFGKVGIILIPVLSVGYQF